MIIEFVVGSGGIVIILLICYPIGIIVKKVFNIPSNDFDSTDNTVR